MSNTLLAWG